MSSSPPYRFSRLRDLGSNATPPLSSPGPCSSPADERYWERCPTPVSPTPHSSGRVVKLYHNGSSSPGWSIPNHPSSTKMDLDMAYDLEDELTDDEFENGWTSGADRYQKTQQGIRLQESGVARNDPDMLSAVEILLSLGRDTQRVPVLARPQPKHVSALPQASSNPLGSVPIVDVSLSPVVEPIRANPSPVVPPTPTIAPTSPAIVALPAVEVASPTIISSASVSAPTTPIKPRKPLADANDIDLGELSDLTPLKPSPQKPVQLKKRIAHISTTPDSCDIDDISLEPDILAASHKRVTKRKRNAASAAERFVAKKRIVDTSRAEDLNTLDVDPATVTDLEGFLIETLALSRSSSMSTEQLTTAVLAEQSHLRPQRSDEEWSGIFASILKARQVFGRIRRNGKDAKGKPIDDQWYYQPEHDNNAERASLLGGHGRSKRTAAKKEDVQYYWKPIPKNRVVRW